MGGCWAGVGADVIAVVAVDDDRGGANRPDFSGYC